MTESSATRSRYTERFAEYYRQLGFSCQVVDGSLWLEENRIIFPLGPASASTVISKSTADAMLSHSQSAIMVRCTDGFQSGLASGDWYAVICKHRWQLENYSANTRSKLRRGLRQNEVRKIDAEYYAKHGYDVYVAACARYHASPRTRDRFCADVMLARDFNDIIEFWGVFHEGALVGRALNHLYGNTEVAYSSLTFDPDYFKFYSAYALIYCMNEYYLREKDFEYVNDGFRTLLHPTDLQEMLVNTFGFERAYTHLHLHYKPYVSWIMSLPKSVRKLLGRTSSRFAALNALHEARTIAHE
jgi:hypothetical protein